MKKTLMDAAPLDATWLAIRGLAIDVPQHDNSPTDQIFPAVDDQDRQTDVMWNVECSQEVAFKAPIILPDLVANYDHFSRYSNLNRDVILQWRLSRGRRLSSLRDREQRLLVGKKAPATKRNSGVRAFPILTSESQRA
jgi:hypothetical protein